MGRPIRWMNEEPLSSSEMIGFCFSVKPKHKSAIQAKSAGTLRAVKARSYIMTAGTKDPMSIFVPSSNLLSQLCTFPLGET